MLLAALSENKPILECHWPLLCRNTLHFKHILVPVDSEVTRKYSGILKCRCYLCNDLDMTSDPDVNHRSQHISVNCQRCTFSQPICT